MEKLKETNRFKYWKVRTEIMRVQKEYNEELFKKKLDRKKISKLLDELYLLNKKI